jgi:hypothetical protein
MEYDSDAIALLRDYHSDTDASAGPPHPTLAWGPPPQAAASDQLADEQHLVDPATAAGAEEALVRALSIVQGLDSRQLLSACPGVQAACLGVEEHYQCCMSVAYAHLIANIARAGTGSCTR